MAKFRKIINIEDSMGKHWDIDRALRWNDCPISDLATNADDGLEMIEAAIKEGSPYELLITDMQFQVQGVYNENAGFYVIEELRRRKIEIPIIVCSSIRYNIPEIAGCVFYNKNKDLEWDFKEILTQIIQD